MHVVKVTQIKTGEISLMYFKELPACLLRFIDYSKYSVEIKELPRTYGEI